MNTIIKNAIILMGKDPYEFKHTYSRFRADGEVYLDFINKFEVEIFGKKIGRTFFEEYDKSKLTPQDAIVIGAIEMQKSVEQYTQGLRKGYVFMQQKGNRYLNLLGAKETFKLQGATYVIAPDLPQVGSIDDRIREILHKSNGQIKAINFLFGNIEDFGEFWRSPFFFRDDGYLIPRKHDTVHGFKEAQDYILDIGKVNLKKMSSLNPGTKLKDPKVLAALIAAALPRIFSSDVKYVPQLITQGLKIQLASMRYHKQGLAYHSGDSRKMLEGIAHVFAGIPANELNVAVSSNMAFYKDFDSAQDAFRHAKQIWQNNHPGQEILYEDLNEHITYKGRPLLDLVQFRIFYSNKQDFYSSLRKKEEKMIRSLAKK